VSTEHEYKQGPTTSSGATYRTRVDRSDGEIFEVSIWVPDWRPGSFVGTIRCVRGDGSGTVYQDGKIGGAYASIPSVHAPGDYPEHSACFDALIAIAPIAQAVADAVEGAVQG
jgi:hypothetical protein